MSVDIKFTFFIHQINKSKIMQERLRLLDQHRLASLNKALEAIRTPGAVGFLTKHVPDFYASISPGDEQVARQLVIDAFTLLGETTKSPTPTIALESAAEVIYKDIFKQEAPDFWFTPIHHRYKTEGKPERVIPVLASYFKGNRVLDVGGGSGYLSMQLQKAGYSPALTDVLDYRAEETQSLSFKLMTSPTQLPYDDDQFDSAFFFEVLHHVDDSRHIPLLTEAGRVAKRVIIIENVYGTMNHPLLRIDHEHEDSSPTADYLLMPPEHQLKTLMLMDYYVNIASKGIIDMNIPFRFKTIGEWLSLFDTAGLEPVSIAQIGFFRNTLNRNFQLYFILDKKE